MFDWSLNVGAKPDNSTLAFVPITFEMTILFAGLATAAAFLARTGLFPGAPARLAGPRVTDDRFAVALRWRSTVFDTGEARRVLLDSGATVPRGERGDVPSDRGQAPHQLCGVRGDTAHAVLHDLLDVAPDSIPAPPPVHVEMRTCDGVPRVRRACGGPSRAISAAHRVERTAQRGGHASESPGERGSLRHPRTLDRGS